MGYTGTPPDYAGGSLANVVAELERRLTGDAPFPGLRDHLADLVPEAASYLLVLFDGLGARQLDHPEAGAFRATLAGTLDSPFPATTTTALATLASGLPASRHGLLGYQLWVPEVANVVNTIHWTTLWGEPVDYDTTGLLPAPNLAERLTAAGAEPVTVQPLHFEDSPLTGALYRGCRFEGIQTTDEMISVPLMLARPERRLVVHYVPYVDFAGHVSGQASDVYAEAMSVASLIWERIVDGLPPNVVAVGVADHGHIDFPPDRQVQIEKPLHEGRTFYGDGRVMFVKGEGESLAETLPATWVPIDECRDWWGPGPRHPAFDERAPDGILVADDGYLLLHRFSDTRMIGNHGGLHPDEQEIPLLVAGG